MPMFTDGRLSQVRGALCEVRGALRGATWAACARGDVRGGSREPRSVRPRSRHAAPHLAPPTQHSTPHVASHFARRTPHVALVFSFPPRPLVLCRGERVPFARI